MQETNQKTMQRQGVIVFVALAVFSILEYLVAVYFYSPMLLAITAGPKAILIMVYYMHISKVGDINQEGEGH